MNCLYIGETKIIYDMPDPKDMFDVFFNQVNFLYSA